MGGYVVRDTTGQAVAWVYARDTIAEAMQAKVLTKDEACRITINIARLKLSAANAVTETGNTMTQQNDPMTPPINLVELVNRLSPRDR